MPLTQQQMDSLQTILTNQGTAAFYDGLYNVYKDPYGRLGGGVSRNDHGKGN